MSLERIRSWCLAKPGAVEDEPWGEAVWKVGGKVFCFGGSTGGAVTVKTTPDRQTALVQDPAVEVAKYVGRFGWVTVTIFDDETWSLAQELIDDSYRSVVEGLPKSKRP